MAFRDARRNRGRLALASLCVALGVSAVGATHGFRSGLQAGIGLQAKSLLGSDLMIESREPFSKDTETFLRALGGEQASQIAFSSMAYFPGAGIGRLVQVRAISPGFPYYGTLETAPPEAVNTFHSGPQALVDETLLLQFGARVGDRVRLGDQEFRIAGGLRKLPGEALGLSWLGPRVVVPIEYVDRGALAQTGRLVRYRVHFKIDASTNVDQFVAGIAGELARRRLHAETVTRRLAGVSRITDNLARYLALAAFIAVLLAGVGLASGMHAYAKAKTASVATLRCLGSLPNEAVLVYVIQAVGVAFTGSAFGAVAGALIQNALAFAFRDFVPVVRVVEFSVGSTLAGVAIGFASTLLFCLWPLVSLRRV
ncbi:MAG TPA: ABC transporter permease, partial [Candidatus Binatia bacterium]|nr:ABC transporter permease [Candidatus Binatia bacterium]